MKQFSIRRISAAVLAAVLLLTGSASALFGKKTAEPVEGAPTAQDLEIRTYRDIPCEGQFLASDSEGEDLTFAVEKEPGKGSVTID